MPLRCAASTRCTGRIRLLTRGGQAAQAAATLGGARFTIGAGQSKAVRVRLTRRGRIMLGRANRLQVVVAVASRGEVTRRTVTLRG